MILCRLLADFFQNQLLDKYIYHVRASISLDIDQARHFVGLIWVQTVFKDYRSAENTGRLRLKQFGYIFCRLEQKCWWFIEPFTDLADTIIAI